MTGPIQFLLDNLDLPRLTNVLDVGANPLEDPPYKRLLDLRGCRLFGFEPQVHAFEKLQETKSDLETYYNCAVGSGRHAVLNAYHSQGLSSLFDIDQTAASFVGMGPRMCRVTERIPMQTIALDAIEDIPNQDVLKIDVQGAELEIISSGQRVLSEAVVIIPEVRFARLYHNEPLMGDLDLALRAKGFTLHKFLFPKTLPIPNSQSARIRPRRVRSQLVDGDAVYIKNPTRPAGFTSEQLKHLALMSGSVFDSFDLCLRCLDLLVERKDLNPDMPSGFVDTLPMNLRRS